MIGTDWSEKEIKQRLENENEVYGWVLSDLETIEKMVEELEKKYPSEGSAIPDTLYLQTVALHILIVSQFEYLLKSLGMIERQSGIINIINESKVLGQLEKDHLLYLFFVRHTIVHNGGHPDMKFFKDIKSKIKKLKVDFPQDDRNLTTIPPSSLKIYIKILKKIIILETPKLLKPPEDNLLSDTEKKS